jgi:hypothetical protein
MNEFDRRQFLNTILSNLTLAAGTVVLASTSVSSATAHAAVPDESETPPADLQQRADHLASEATASETAGYANEFLNGGFRNTPLGRFRNSPLGGFRNTPIGGFRNTPLGGFRNTPLGGFRNSPLGTFGNGGWPNGQWGAFNNGGWPNFGWNNWW